jgi:transcription elongation factor GreB
MKIKNYITQIGFQKLADEYNHLLKVERPDILKVIAWAAGNGDRSENADYQYGRKRLREIDGRLRFLKQRLETAEIVHLEGRSTDVIRFGHEVYIEDEDKGTSEWVRIVGSDEIDLKKRWMSWNSPIGKALLNKKEGDEVSVMTPQGERSYTIRGIREWMQNGEA